MFQDHLQVVWSLMTNGLCWGTLQSSPRLPLLLDLWQKNKYAPTYLVLLLKCMHSQCILEGLVYIHCGTTLPPTNKIYTYQPTANFIMEKWIRGSITHIVFKKKMLRINIDKFRSQLLTTFLRFPMMWNPCSLRVSKAISLTELCRAKKHIFI